MPQHRRSFHYGSDVSGWSHQHFRRRWITQEPDPALHLLWRQAKVALSYPPPGLFIYLLRTFLKDSGIKNVSLKNSDSSIKLEIVLKTKEKYDVIAIASAFHHIPFSKQLGFLKRVKQMMQKESLFLEHIEWETNN